MSNQEIKIGDKVRCIDAGASFHRLIDGGIYTVEANFDGSPTVMVNRSSHCLERFERVAASGETKIAISGALEIYDIFPEHTKEANE